MKISSIISVVGCVLLASFAGTAHAMGEPVQVFEHATAGGFWGGGADFNLRIDLDQIGDLKNQKFIWGQFHKDGASTLSGELVVDNFGPNERHFPARATIMTSTSSATYYLIELVDDNGAVTKEFVLKGPRR